MEEVVVMPPTNEPRRGEIWWGESPDRKGRPYLVITRSAAVPVLNRILVAPVTRTIRGIRQEVHLGLDEGLPFESVASFDNVMPFPKSMLTRHLGALAGDRVHEICDAIAAATSCERRG